ncbi:hypothetical protein ACVIDN_004924 [Rhizobium brockwellii]
MNWDDRCLLDSARLRGAPPGRLSADNALTGRKRCPVRRECARQIENHRLGLNCVLEGTNLTLIYYGIP